MRAYCLSYTDYSSLVASNSLVQRSGYSKQYTVPVSALSSYSSSWQQHYTGSTTYCTGSVCARFRSFSHCSRFN